MRLWLRESTHSKHYNGIYPKKSFYQDRKCSTNGVCSIVMQQPSVMWLNAIFDNRRCSKKLSLTHKPGNTCRGMVHQTSNHCQMRWTCVFPHVCRWCVTYWRRLLQRWGSTLWPSRSREARPATPTTGRATLSTVSWHSSSAAASRTNSPVSQHGLWRRPPRTGRPVLACEYRIDPVFMDTADPDKWKWISWSNKLRHFMNLKRRNWLIV